MPLSCCPYREAKFQNRLLTPDRCAKQLSNVVYAWYNADPENLTLVSGLVSRASDLSGHNNDGVQDTAGNRLTFFPEKPMFGNRASFGSTTKNGNRHLASPSLAVKHVFLSVYYKDGVGATFDDYAFFFSGTGTFGDKRVMGNLGGAGLISTSVFASVGYKNGTTSSSATVLPLPASVCRFDGDVTQVFQIGGSSVVNNRGFVGGFRNVILATTLSLYQIQLIEGVMAWDSGTQGLLIAGHPYANIPPLRG